MLVVAFVKLDKHFIQQIHDADGKIILAITGGGASSVTKLLAVPGASNTLLSAFIPYHDEELTAYLGEKPETACSSKTARTMAMVAWQRARELEREGPVFGVGCTAALATNRDRRGTDRCFVAIQSAERTTEIAVTFDKSGRSREKEEHLCSTLVLGFIAESLGIEIEYLAELRKTDTVTRNKINAEPAWQDLYSQRTSVTPLSNSPELIFPGTFNPMHQGHQRMVDYAQRQLGKPVTLEISVTNVDKPPLDFIEMHTRCEALQDWPLAFSNAPTFVEKCRLFPGTTFLVGIDTLMRIIALKYYDSSEEKRDQVLQEISSLGNKFLVFGRQTAQGFLTLSDLDIPASLAERCIGVSQEDFMEDISSTEIRNREEAKRTVYTPG